MISIIITLLFHVLFICVGGVCNFLGSVSPQPRCEMQSSVTAQLQLRVLFSKRRKLHPHECRSIPKERPLFFGAPKLKSVLASSFYMFVYCSLKPPYVNCASQEECVFHLRFSLQPSDILLFHFLRAFPFLCLATDILDSFFLF